MTHHSPRNSLVFCVVNPSAQKVVTVALDPLERMILTLTRHLCLLPSGPDHPAWIAAHTASRRILPMHDAALTVAAHWQLIRAIAKSRQSDFNFLKPSDRNGNRFITPEELSVIRLIQFLRQKRSVEAQTQVIVLSEGCACNDLLTAANRLASLFENHERR